MRRPEPRLDDLIAFLTPAENAKPNFGANDEQLIRWPFRLGDLVRGRPLSSIVLTESHTKAEAVSAGTEPGLRVHPEVLTAMHEIGIDLSAAKPQKLTQELANDAGRLITMGCGDKCPYVPGLRRDDWPLPDPKGRPMDEVRAVRDDIKARVAELIQAEGLEKAAV
jgi:arsenate reductase